MRDGQRRMFLCVYDYILRLHLCQNKRSASSMMNLLPSMHPLHLRRTGSIFNHFFLRACTLMHSGMSKVQAFRRVCNFARFLVWFVAFLCKYWSCLPSESHFSFGAFLTSFWSHFGLIFLFLLISVLFWAFLANFNVIFYANFPTKRTILDDFSWKKLQNCKFITVEFWLMKQVGHN